MKSSSDYQVVSICEPDAGAAGKARANPAFEGLRWVSEDEMLSDKSLQLIVVECRPWDALPFGKKVVAAGKHLHLHLHLHLGVETTEVFATALVLYFLIVGFFGGYLITIMQLRSQLRPTS